MATRKSSSLHGRPTKREYADPSRFPENFTRQRPSENLHHDTGGLEFVGHGIYTYSKQLNKLKSKVDQKRKQTKSKHLESYETKYDSTYLDLTSEIKKLKQLLPAKDDEGDEAGFEKKCHECVKKSRKIRRLEQDAKEFNGNIDQIVIDLSSAENKVSQFQNQLDVLTGQLREETSSKEDAIRRVSKLQNQLGVLTEQLREETSSKEDAIRRLSELASSKLRDNNPNIADLSDSNRPTKLAEQVSELYDNEWTDAFDELETNRCNDWNIVDYLLKAFMNIYKECRRITTDGFFKKIQGCIEHSDVIPQGNSELDLPDQLRQQAKDFRKSSAAKNIENIIDGITKQSSLGHLHKQPYDAAKAKMFIRKCIKLSWLMCVQDPPMVLSTETPMEFSTTLFREYTSRGPYVAYVVWPIMYLHEGGPVLSKGVAQGSKQDSRDQISQIEKQNLPRHGTTAIATTATGTDRVQPPTLHGTPPLHSSKSSQI